MRRVDLAEGVTLKRFRAKERQRRYRLRQKGEDVPFEPLGPKPGFKQSEEHIQKRKMFGAANPNWKGDDISEKSGRSRALRAFPSIGPCVSCGCKPAERHHADGNTANNAQENIKVLCRRCHMAEDGRLEEARRWALARNN